MNEKKKYKKQCREQQIVTNQFAVNEISTPILR